MNNTYLARDLNQLSCPSVKTPLFRSCLHDTLMLHPRPKREVVISFIENCSARLTDRQVVLMGLGSSTVALILLLSITTQTPSLPLSSETARLDTKQIAPVTTTAPNIQAVSAATASGKYYPQIILTGN